MLVRQKKMNKLLEDFKEPSPQQLYSKLQTEQTVSRLTASPKHSTQAKPKTVVAPTSTQAKPRFVDLSNLRKLHLGLLTPIHLVHQCEPSLHFPLLWSSKPTHQRE
ncbi:hypothetical protein PoB_003319900 [Plakobranchus ocellatus]|uniref:Uncharacterized protein n=1 Tax=Plakobranchus ocellatus TaxID=259542 RepID=A0AAV4AGA3_9GAST|nr:hypothetical protein PoB_003319900 [Plakobranchus ocellatus]